VAVRGKGVVLHAVEAVLQVHRETRDDVSCDRAFVLPPHEAEVRWIVPAKVALVLCADLSSGIEAGVEKDRSAEERSNMAVEPPPKESCADIAGIELAREVFVLVRRSPYFSRGHEHSLPRRGGCVLGRRGPKQADSNIVRRQRRVGMPTADR